MKQVIISVLWAVFIILGPAQTVATATYLPAWLHSIPTNAFTYHFFHANIFHLLANCLSIWLTCTVSKRRSFSKLCQQLMLAYIISTAIYPLTSLPYGIFARPLCGFSNILFALIGLRTPPFSQDWWIRRNTLIFFLGMLLTLLLPHFAAITHIVSFMFGAILAAILRNI